MKKFSEVNENYLRGSNIEISRNVRSQADFSNRTILDIKKRIEKLSKEESIKYLQSIIDLCEVSIDDIMSEIK